MSVVKLSSESRVGEEGSLANFGPAVGMCGLTMCLTAQCHLYFVGRQLHTTFCSYKKLAISKHKTFCHHKTCYEAQNFIIPLIRQFLVGAVIGCLSVHYIQSLKSFFFMWLKSFSGTGLQLQFFYATNAILLVL